MGNAHALAIGISRYRHVARLPEVFDAQDVHEVLHDPAIGGYTPGPPPLLEQAATKSAIVEALASLARRTDDSSSVFFYFSGHGGRARETCYLMPVDGDPAALDRTALSGPELTELLRAIPAARMTVVLDCCRAAGMAEPKDVVALEPELTAASLSPLAAGRGRTVFAASRADGYAYVVPGQRNGIFTGHLLEGLRGAAGGAGGVIRVCDLFHYVQQRVVATGVQRPVFRAELEENYPIALCPSDLRLPPPPDAFAYDAFVSYRRRDPADRAWVEGILIPRLQRAGLKLCLEREFQLGQPRIREMERAVTTSRYTLAVFTPAYLEGNFEDFQSLIGQHNAIETATPRFIPLLRRSCRPPLGARMTELLDISDEAEVDAALERLALRLREPPRPRLSS
jgi:hypothetical protein